MFGAVNTKKIVDLQLYVKSGQTYSSMKVEFHNGISVPWLQLVHQCRVWLNAKSWSQFGVDFWSWFGTDAAICGILPNLKCLMLGETLLCQHHCSGFANHKDCKQGIFNVYRKQNFLVGICNSVAVGVVGYLIMKLPFISYLLTW